MKIKDIVKSKRTWAIIALAALQVFGVQVPDVFSSTLHAFIGN